MPFGKYTLLSLLILTGVGAQAQQIVAGVDFTTRFDNREYSGMGYQPSETFFGMRLTPQLGLHWDEHNTLMIGVDMLQNFGDESTFFSEVKPQVWYQYEAPKVLAAAGIFPRSKLRGDYGEAFFDRSYLFYHNRIQGVMGQYRSERGFVEFAIDWEGMQSPTNRERFRILSAGQYDGTHLYGGYALSVLHYAKTSDPRPNEGVVDNILINPYGGGAIYRLLRFRHPHRLSPESPTRPPYRQRLGSPEGRRARHPDQPLGTHAGEYALCG